jgi:hypothetical protein
MGEQEGGTVVFFADVVAVLASQVGLLVTKGTEIMGAARDQHEAGASFAFARGRRQDAEELASLSLR